MTRARAAGPMATFPNFKKWNSFYSFPKFASASPAKPNATPKIFPFPLVLVSWSRCAYYSFFAHQIFILLHIMNRQWVRLFSSTGLRTKSYSSVQPVHHLVEVKKSALSPKYKEVLLPKDDIESVGYRPTEIEQDRLAEHYKNTLQSDLMLHFFDHANETIPGSKKRKWAADSPYALYRAMKKPQGTPRATRDIKPVTPRNIPELTGIAINLYSKEALEHTWLNISARVFIAQITNVKPKKLKSKSNILQWKVRQGKPCGCKVELTGSEMSRFFTTLTELVLPRIRTFQGVKLTSGDGGGNITFGLDPEHVKFFPEVENFQELHPNLFGFHITFKTSARTDEAARTLLSSMGVPFYNP